MVILALKSEQQRSKINFARKIRDTCDFCREIPGISRRFRENPGNSEIFRQNDGKIPVKIFWKIPEILTVDARFLEPKMTKISDSQKSGIFSHFGSKKRASTVKIFRDFPKNPGKILENSVNFRKSRKINFRKIYFPKITLNLSP